MPRESELPLQTRIVHGHRRAFVLVGTGPAVLLLHGLGCDHSTWSPLIERLSRRFTVLAPDLFGHGASDKPRADYTLGGYANGMRDLLVVLGIDRVTVVGHSFGGGVAMQFAYQFPQYTERLMLIAPGGIGREVNPVLRALTLPGAAPVLAALAAPPVLAAARFLGGCARAARLPGTADVRGALSVLAGKHDARERDAFLHVLRGVVDWRGQVVTMTDRAYLGQNMPTCVLWGDRDTVLPVGQAETARRTIPGVRIEIVAGGGHFPHEEFPDRCALVLADFAGNTPASVYDAARWRALLRAGRAQRPPPSTQTAAVSDRLVGSAAAPA